MRQQRQLVALTMGDPAGIGPEVCLKAIRDIDRESCAVILFGDAEVLRKLSREAKLALPPVASNIQNASVLALAVGASVLHIESLGSDWTPGVVSEKTGRASFVYITSAIEAALLEQVNGIVTGPIHKEALRLSGVRYPGHTEIFDALANRRTRHPTIENLNMECCAEARMINGGSRHACMMLTSDALTCSFVTTHVGLCDVPKLISVERVLDVIELTDAALRKMKHPTPRLVVCGLNPHAGEGGLFGKREEEQFIAPAVALAQRKHIDVIGPLPPDTAFLPKRRQWTDAFICMYHDQGHIPLKALSFETAVNTTLGIPIVRTSVDHGTALDIAWKSFNADATSMLQAIRLASRLITPIVPALYGALR